MAFSYDKKHVLRLIRWARDHEREGRTAFVLAYIGSLVLMLPGSVLALIAGAFYNFYWGCALVYISNVIGQTLAFLLARYFLRDHVQRCISARWQHFSLIDAAIRREGATLVFVLRLNPCMPYNILNYALGLTSIPLVEYTWSSAISVLPFVVSYVYLGCLSSNVMEIVDGGWAAHGAMLPWLLVSCAVVAASIAYGYWFTKRALAEAIEGAMTPRRAGALSSQADGFAGPCSPLAQPHETDVDAL